MAIYFHRVTALGLPVNLLVVPLIGLALPSALITFSTLLLWPSLAIGPAAVTAALLHAINGIVQLFSTVGAGDIRLSSPGTLAIVTGMLLIGLAVWAARNSRFPVASPVRRAGLFRRLCFLSPRARLSPRRARSHRHRCRPGGFSAADLAPGKDPAHRCRRPHRGRPGLQRQL